VRPSVGHRRVSFVWKDNTVDVIEVARDEVRDHSQLVAFMGQVDTLSDFARNRTMRPSEITAAQTVLATEAARAVNRTAAQRIAAECAVCVSTRRRFAVRVVA
jgi:hypothetical protein